MQTQRGCCGRTRRALRQAVRWQGNKHAGFELIPDKKTISQFLDRYVSLLITVLTIEFETEKKWGTQ